MNKNYISWFKINNSTHLFLSTFNHLSLAGLLVVTSSAFGQSASEEVKQTKQQDDVVQFPALSVVGNLNSSVGAGSSVLKLKDI
ncbi:TPA: TonB-dependent receptor, partial [Providencia stuartii]